MYVYKLALSFLKVIFKKFVLNLFEFFFEHFNGIYFCYLPKLFNFYF